LQDAAGRVLAIARAHERLYRNDDIAALDLGDYLRDVCRDLEGSFSGCSTEVSVADGIRVATDTAVPLALIVTELVTNAAKYAFPGQTKCTIRVVLARRSDDHLTLTVSDDGVGLPPGFNLQDSKSLGMRIVRAFASQLGAQLTLHPRERGAQFILLVPLNPSA